MYSETSTITFGDVAENHARMQQVGKLAEKGFSYEEIIRADDWFKSRGCYTEIIELNNYLPDEARNVDSNKAYVLVIKNAVNSILERVDGADVLMDEQKKLEKDTKAFMYGRVVNKHARHNLCFGEKDQEPDYEKGMGRIYAFDKLPHLKMIREKLYDILGESANGLQAEGNYYYDVSKCGIGFHGDSERRKVVAVRLGATIPLHYVWYKNSEPVSEQIKILNLEHGDMYIMSDKAVGNDWKKKTIYTLRHAAGCEKFTKIDDKK